MADQKAQIGAPDGEDHTADLLERARAGDRSALDELFARHSSLLRRWAARRLPQWARFGMDTVDLVQETMLTLFRNLEGFEPRGEGALQAYLRQGLINRVRSQVRNAHVRPGFLPLDPSAIDDITSPLEAAIGRQSLEAYERALAHLPPDTRAAVVSRVELGMSYADIAAVLDKPSASAARMAVARALVRIAEEMDRT
jgi:RNA polymerase sigma-70 factor (ECF subfamily)